jgi:hypothetical protein
MRALKVGITPGDMSIHGTVGIGCEYTQDSAMMGVLHDGNMSY